MVSDPKEPVRPPTPRIDFLIDWRGDRNGLSDCAARPWWFNQNDVHIIERMKFNENEADVVHPLPVRADGVPILDHPAASQPDVVTGAERPALPCHRVEHCK